MSDSETQPERKSIIDRQRERKEKRQAKRQAMLRGMRTKDRIREVTSVPMGSLSDLSPPRSGLPRMGAPSPSPVAAAPGAAASPWWMDPKILLLGAAALLILMRKK